MPFFTDQLGRQVEINTNPKRIISIVPSQTELIFDLGLDEEVIAITKFCVHPDIWFRNKTRIGGTKQLHIKKIKELKPDLILANKEENTKEQIEELAKDFPVWVSDIRDLASALAMIASVGNILGRKEKAQEIINRINESFKQMPVLNHQPSTAYFIWRDPYMSVGGDTFISDMMERAGFRNIFKEIKRYPCIELSDLESFNCELLMLSSEPYPFGQKHVKEIQSHFPQLKIIFVDGEMFSWYGSRLLKAPAYFEQLQLQVLSLAHASGTQ